MFRFFTEDLVTAGQKTDICNFGSDGIVYLPTSSNCEKLKRK